MVVKNNDPKSKLESLLGKDTVAELEALSPEALNKRIADANAVISDTKAELEALPEYQELKENKKAIESGYREVKSRQNAIIKFCLELRK